LSQSGSSAALTVSPTARSALGAAARSSARNSGSYSRSGPAGESSDTGASSGSRLYRAMDLPPWSNGPPHYRPLAGQNHRPGARRRRPGSAREAAHPGDVVVDEALHELARAVAGNAAVVGDQLVLEMD